MWCGCREAWTQAPLDRRQALAVLAALVAAGCAPVTTTHRDAAERLAEESPAALLARGHSREDVAKVVGGNFLRVYAQVAA